MRYRIEHERLDDFATIRMVDTLSGECAQVAPELGFNLFRLRLAVAGKPLPILVEPPSLRELKEFPSRYGHPILFPFPNRIRSGRFVWNGREFAMPANAGGHAIHGFALRSAWRVVTSEATDTFARVVAQWRLSTDAPQHRQHWPADAMIQVEYRLEPSLLSVETTIRNPDATDLPWGVGFHTYFNMPLTAEAETGQAIVFIPAARRWELDGFLPTGRKVELPPRLDFRHGLPMSGLKADDVLTSLEHGADGSSESRLVDTRSNWDVFMSTSREFTEMVVFTPSWNARAIALEPYTQTTDAINLKTKGIDGGLRTMPPGDSARLWVRIGTRPGA